MELPVRTKLVRVHPNIQSIYKARSGGLAPLAGLKAGRMVPDAAEALWLLHEACEGRLGISDCLRSVDKQAQTRKKYERWLAAGKPTGAAFNSKTMKAAFVARPGRSFHCGGRAIDVDHMAAAPEEVPRSLKLDWLWEQAIPLGWRPVIRAAKEGAKEAWHFDYMGEWSDTYDRIGYEQTAICTVLDLGIGKGVFSRPWERWVQAQLHRLGQDVGDVDGYLGKRSLAGLAALNLDKLEPEAMTAGLLER